MVSSQDLFGIYWRAWRNDPILLPCGKTNIAGWNIPMSNGKCIFISGPFSSNQSKVQEYMVVDFLMLAGVTRVYTLHSTKIVDIVDWKKYT